MPARGRKGKIDGRILIYGEKERKTEGSGGAHEEEEKLVVEEDGAGAR